jgi:hypothetical protein
VATVTITPATEGRVSAVRSRNPRVPARFQQGSGQPQDDNAFLGCADPAVLQQLADFLEAKHIVERVQKWLAYLTPFFTCEEPKQQGCQHRLFFAQVEYCNDLIFRRREGLDPLHERLLDANRSIGRPQTPAQIFGRRINRCYRGKLQTTIEDLDLGHPYNPQPSKRASPNNRAMAGGRLAWKRLPAR